MVLIKKKKMTLMSQNIPVSWIPVDIGHHHHSNTGHSVAWRVFSVASQSWRSWLWIPHNHERVAYKLVCSIVKKERKEKKNMSGTFPGS